MTRSISWRELFIDARTPAALLSFWRYSIRSFLLRPGDTALTAQIGTAFYIVERVASNV